MKIARLSTPAPNLEKTHSDFIPVYGKRYDHDETISTAFVESTVNDIAIKRFVKIGI
jgi:hypothetical protein